jgi:hypothetical protein
LEQNHSAAGEIEGFSTPRSFRPWASTPAFGAPNCRLIAEFKALLIRWAAGSGGVESRGPGDTPL